jgi:hypothetical protein
LSWPSATGQPVNACSGGEMLSRRERKQIERQLQAEDPGWEIVHRNVAGIDGGNESHFVAVDARQADPPVREFGSWTTGLQQRADWLKTCQVQRVVLQTTGVYWIPVQDVLSSTGRYPSPRSRAKVYVRVWMPFQTRFPLSSYRRKNGPVDPRSALT